MSTGNAASPVVLVEDVTGQPGGLWTARVKMPDGRSTIVAFPKVQTSAQTVIFSMQAAALLWPMYVQRTQPGG